MANKIKNVPKGATKSIATLDCPSEFTDERPSSWYNSYGCLNNLNLSIFQGAGND
jgi:hypothetical protein